MLGFVIAFKLAFKKYNGLFATPYLPGNIAFMYTASVKCIIAPKIEKKNINPELPTRLYCKFAGTKILSQ